MINIKYVNSGFFAVNDAILPRNFDANINRFGRVIIRNITLGARFDLGIPGDVTIENDPFNLDELKSIAYNNSCVCEPGPTPPAPTLKIFDITFDLTFN